MDVRDYKVIPRIKETDLGNGNVQKTKRYVVVSCETGELLDDAQGYGYTTAQKAHRAWTYKSNPSNSFSPETTRKAKEKAKVVKYAPILDWCSQHTEFVSMLEQKACEIPKEDCDYADRFSSGYVWRALRESGLEVVFNHVLLYNQIVENVERSASTEISL